MVFAPLRQTAHAAHEVLRLIKGNFEPPWIIVAEEIHQVPLSKDTPNVCAHTCLVGWNQLDQAFTDNILNARSDKIARSILPVELELNLQLKFCGSSLQKVFENEPERSAKFAILSFDRSEEHTSELQSPMY